MLQFLWKYYIEYSDKWKITGYAATLHNILKTKQKHILGQLTISLSGEGTSISVVY